MKPPMHEFAENGIVQLHKHHPNNTFKTDFLCQGGPFETSKDYETWLEEQLNKYKIEYPTFAFMICDSTSRHFMKDIS